MKKYLFLCSLFLSEGLFAVELYANVRDNEINVYLKNNSSFEEIVNRRFAWGHLGRPSELAFVFTDNTGKYVEYSAKGGHPATEKDFISIRSNQTVGASFVLDKMIRTLGVPPGEYQLTIFYKNYSNAVANAFSEELESDPIAIEVTKAQIDGAKVISLHNGRREGFKREYSPLVDGHPRR